MNIGFTGTRLGMTDCQLQVLRAALIERAPATVHHGDCVGADEQCHQLATELGLEIVVHPPVLAGCRAFVKGGTHLLPKPYLQRNREIVDACDLLIAAPSETYHPRSGTWFTMRYAEQVGKPVIII